MPSSDCLFTFFAGHGFAVVRRREALLLAEKAAEVQRIIISHDGGNFINIIVRGFQQAGCVVDANGQQVLHGRLFKDLLEIPQEPADTHAPGLGVFLNIDLLVVMLVKIPSGILDFLLQIGADGGFAFQTATLDQQEDLPQIHLYQFLIAHTAGLQFVDHLFENVGVCRGGSGIKNILIQWDIILPQYILDIAAGEVDPVYLRLILAKVLVVHDLFRQKEDHITGRHFNIFAVDIKVCLSGGDIQ